MRQELDKLINLNEKKTELLKEYRESLKYDDCTHDLVQDPLRPNHFMLYEISTQVLVRYGSEINRCLDRRKITAVYNIELITPKPKPDVEGDTTMGQNISGI